LRFAVHGPAQRPASPRGHRPPDGDVLGRVHVRVIGVPAGATAKDRSPVPGDPVGLCLVGDLAGPAEPHPAHLGNPQLADLARHAAYVPVISAPADDPETLVPACLAPCRPPMCSGEEIRHSLGKVPRRLLLHRLRSGGQPRERLPCFGQLTGLFPIAWCARTSRPPMRVLLHGQIPNKSGMHAVLQQRLLLGKRGLKPKPHANTLSTTTDERGRERRRYPGLKAGGATPRCR
jgi:hypothetical protein